MRQNEILTSLAEWGLTNYEARAYIALLDNPAAPASVIARNARIPRPRVYDVLRRLWARGFATRSSGGRIIYRPVAPAEVIGRLREEEARRQARRDKVGPRLEMALAKIYARASHESAPEEYIEIVKNAKRLLNLQSRLNKNAKSRILSFNKPPYVTPLPPPGGFAKVLAPAVAVLKRGVEVRSIFELGRDTAEWEQRSMEFLQRHGERIRIARRLPMKMVVADGKEAIIALEDPATAKPTITSLHITHKGLAEALETLFESFWPRAKPFGRPTGNGRRVGGTRRPKRKRLTGGGK